MLIPAPVKATASSGVDRRLVTAGHWAIRLIASC
jgi:hypothetical protein